MTHTVYKYGRLVNSSKTGELLASTAALLFYSLTWNNRAKPTQSFVLLNCLHFLYGSIMLCIAIHLICPENVNKRILYINADFGKTYQLQDSVDDLLVGNLSDFDEPYQDGKFETIVHSHSHHFFGVFYITKRGFS